MIVQNCDPELMSDGEEDITAKEDDEDDLEKRRVLVSFRIRDNEVSFCGSFITSFITSLITSLITHHITTHHSSLITHHITRISTSLTPQGHQSQANLQRTSIPHD